MTEAIDSELRARANEEVGRAVIALIREEPFFGHLLSGINRKITDETPSAGVSFRNGRPLLAINPDFYLNELPLDGHRSAVIKHEVLHLLLDHSGRFDSRLMDQQLYDLAADLVINQLIGEKWPLPPGAIHLGSFDFPLPPDMTLEWYYRTLLEHSDEIPKDMRPEHSDHEQWAEGDDDDEAPIARHELARAASDAKDRSGDDFALLPESVQELVESLVDELQPTVDWRRVIRLFTEASRRTRISNTLRRPSKRYGTYPGIKVKRLHRLAVIIDTSGSVKQEALGEFFAEVRAIWRQGSEVVVIEADNVVRNTWEFRGESPDKMKGRGGTQFDPALQWVVDSHPPFDAAIYFTDGKANAPTVRPRCGVLWVLPSGGDPQSLQGQRVVRLSS